MQAEGNRAESVRRELAAVAARTGPWSAHNIEVAPGVFTRGAEVSGEELKVRRLAQLVRDLVGRPLEGLRALDLGALEGLYGIELALAGMEVVFVEGRETSAEKIRFARRALGIERGAVYTQDVRQLDPSTHGQFDVILCIGLLYHLELESVLRLLTTMREQCTRLAVIDTHVALEDEDLRRVAGAHWLDLENTLSPMHTVELDGRSYRGRNYLEHDPGTPQEARLRILGASLDNETSFWPTKTTLVNALVQAGFTSVLECLAPPLPGVTQDRVMLAAIPGERRPLSSSSILADVEYEPIPENGLSQASSGIRDVTAGPSPGSNLQRTTRYLPGPVKRLRGLLREIQGLSRETRELVAAVHQEGRTHSEHLAARLDAQQQTLSDLDNARAKDHDQLVEILRFVHDRGQWRRRQLRRLRADPGYERAFADPEPLISVVIPTYDNYMLLRERSIPSVLAQSYQSFEIIVVGDAAPDEARQVVEAFGDQRITFFNLPYRGPYPDDPQTRWLVSGVPAYNEAVARARGLWVAPLDDDDAFRPNHLERLLDYARRNRLELAYSRLAAHFPNGAEATIGRFPPEYQEFGVQAALYHAGLASIFEYELADAPLGLPSDWALCLRMLEGGVRIGMLDEVSVDYYPSRSWTPRWENDRYGPMADAEEAPEWEYVPEGWARAQKPDEPAASGWSVEEVAQAYAEKWPQFLAAVEGPGPMGVNHEVPTGAPIGRYGILDQNAILAFTYALNRAADSSLLGSRGSAGLSVLDFGGALGHYEVLARRLLPELELDYHVREVPAVCAAGRELHPDVTFHDADDCFDRRYELVVASNSLQYFEDWQSLLTRLAEATDGWLFLTRVPTAIRHPSFVVMQRVEPYGYATQTLSWALNREELLETARHVGLALKREFLLHPPWEIAGAPEQISHTGFLFRAPRRT